MTEYWPMKCRQIIGSSRLGPLPVCEEDSEDYDAPGGRSLHHPK